MILTDATGVPFPKPVREDFTTDVDFVRAVHQWRDQIVATANRSFVEGWAIYQIEKSG